ncbi:membrane protein [Anaerococcus lactolyticus]|nr:membrane protein [Anaerococcus lactolyticus]
MSYRLNVISKVMRSRKFFLSILIILLSMIFSLTAFVEEGMEYFFKHDYAMTFLQGYNGDRSLLVILAPLIATLPFSAQHVENSKSGTMKYLVARMGYKKYFNSNFIINFLTSFITFAFGMVIFFIGCFVFFSKNLNMDAYMGMTGVSTYKKLIDKSALLYILAIILHCAFVGACYSSVGLSLSYFIKNKFVAWIGPFIIATIGSLFAMFVGLTKLEPMAIFDVSRVQGMTPIFIISYLLISLFLAYILSLLKFKKDIENDEEI